MKHRFLWILFSFKKDLKVLFLILSCLLCGHNTLARWDLEFTGVARSYPLAVFLDIDVGQSLLLWGDDQKGSPFYGYIRPSLTFSTAGTYNGLGAGLEFFPISFLGFKAGGETFSNVGPYLNYDCDLNECEGLYYRSYAEAHLFFGLGPWFMALRARQSRFQRDEFEGVAFVIPHFAMLSREPLIDIHSGRVITGLNLSEKWRMSFYYLYAESAPRHTDLQVQRLGTLNLTRKWSEWSLSFGGGLFDSNVIEREPTVLMVIQYKPYPAAGL
ncbi:MAG: hypothetical protein AAF203_10480 [Pseudomonadota bacterium]